MNSVFKISKKDRQDFTGKIAITDPCYFFSNSDKTADDLWMRFVNSMWHNENHMSTSLQKSGTFWIGPTMFLYSRTAYGDGSYYVYPSSGYGSGFFPVDAGLFCVVSVNSVKRNPLLDNWGLDGAVIIDLDGKTTFRMDGEGRMYVMRVRLPHEEMWVDTVDEFRDKEEGYWR
jgi:hypothetical protein